MPENKPVEIVEEVTVTVPTSGAAMKQRLEELKNQKDLKKKPSTQSQR